MTIQSPFRMRSHICLRRARRCMGKVARQYVRFLNTAPAAPRDRPAHPRRARRRRPRRQIVAADAEVCWPHQVPTVDTELSPTSDSRQSHRSSPLPGLLLREGSPGSEAPIRCETRNLDRSCQGFRSPLSSRSSLGNQVSRFTNNGPPRRARPRRKRSPPSRGWLHISQCCSLPHVLCFPMCLIISATVEPAVGQKADLLAQIALAAMRFLNAI
jgi:hypothetical protein